MRRSFVVLAVTALAVVMPACSKKHHVIPSVNLGTPLPSSPPAQAACVTGLTTAYSARRRTMSATPTPIPPSTITVDSNPQGLQVEIDGAYVGKTPATATPAYALGPHQITVLNEDNNPDYEVCYVQNGNSPVLPFYYNRVLDTSGKVTSIQSSSRVRQVSSVQRMPSTGIENGSPSIVEVLYKASALHRESVSAFDVESRVGVRSVRSIVLPHSPYVAHVLDVPAGQRDSIIAQLRARSDVFSAQPAQYRYLKTTTPIPAPNDPHFSTTSEWDMYTIGMLNAWAYSSNFGSSSIAVATLDTGLDTSVANTNVQADLIPKLTFEESVIGGVATQGQAAVQDKDGHGTNVAGIALASANNNVGFVGVAPAVSLQVYRIFDYTTGTTTTADEAQAISDAVANHANVINLSLGSCGSDGPDPLEENAIESAISSGVFVVAAAGNEHAGSASCTGTENVLDFPAGYPGVMAVGASALKDNGTGDPATATEYVAAYSNVGPGLGIVAPGGDPSGTDSDPLHWISNLYSTTGNPPCSTPADCWAEMAGTSMATPHVSGAAALLLSANPALTPSQLYDILINSADDINDPDQGHGRLDVYRAMAVVQSDPSPPAYTPTNEQLLVFAYTNSGAIDAAPATADETFPGGILVSSDGTFRIADIPTSVTAYKIGVWYDANGDGKVDAGDLFGSSGPCPVTGPCLSAQGIAVFPVTSNSFALP